MDIIYFFFQNLTLIFSVLAMGAMATLLCERAGVINIAVNGQMIFGALFFAIFCNVLFNKTGSVGPGVQIGFLFAVMVIGAILSLLHSVLTVTFGTNQIIVGVAINLLALGIALFVTNLPNYPSGQILLHTNIIAADSKHKIFNIYFIVSLVLLGLLFVFYRWTKLGTYMAAAGENPHAVNSAGISVFKLRYLAVMIAGVFAALSGAFYTFAISSAFYGNVQGLGFIALAIMIFGQWRVQYISIGVLIFSALYSVGAYLTHFNNIPAGVKANNVIFKVLPFLLTIITMIVFYRYNNTPRFSGIPFVQGERASSN